MMIGRTRTNLRAVIEDQYEILSFLVSDISSRYQEHADEVDAQANEFMKANSDEDYEVVSGEMGNYYAAWDACKLDKSYFVPYMRTTKRCLTES